MTRWSALLAAAVAVGATAGWAPSAAAAACSGTAGVTVVVDYGAAGGGVGVGCAAGDPGSGLAALRGAGHGYEFAPRQAGMVCRIDARPGTCSTSTDAYWSYWHAAPGGSWVYSTLGAGSRDPRPGTVEGWAFGAGAPPSVAPPAPKPAPQPPAPKPPAPKPPAPQPPAPEPTTTTARPAATTSGKPAATAPTTGPTWTTTTGPTTTVSGTAAPTSAATSTESAAPATADIAPSAQRQEDGGSPVSFVIGGAAVVLLGALAFGTARRRAKADQ